MATCSVCNSCQGIRHIRYVRVYSIYRCGKSIGVSLARVARKLPEWKAKHTHTNRQNVLSIKCFYNSNYKWNLWLNFGILTILLVFACFSHLSSLSVLLLLVSSRLLLAPNFVSSFTQGDFVYFFFRETAVEFINCGKVSGGGELKI